MAQKAEIEKENGSKRPEGRWHKRPRLRRMMATRGQERSGSKRPKLRKEREDRCDV